MLIGSTKSRGKDHVPLECSVVFRYPPLNQVSCVIWYVVVYLTPKLYKVGDEDGMGEHSTDEADEVQAGASNSVPPGVPGMASYFGRMDAFNPKEEELLTYVER